ncbi:hypothetical protein ACKWRH_45620 (plasmid) [Bradyrhizobium sp. Pa8]|uniref:hypothetical protein n=1 Tax=Bradyrhizobium sp. Pa8 TaxID=3386552 RepID=UPI00403F1853
MITAPSGYQPSPLAVANVPAGGLSLSSIMILVLMERHDIYLNQIRSEYDDMQVRNNLLKDMNKALATLRTNRPTDEKTIKGYGTFVDSQGYTQDVFEWMQAHGIPMDTKEGHKVKVTWGVEGGKFRLMLTDTENAEKKGVQSQFDAAINNLKAAIDSANSEGQVALIHLQGGLDKLNQVTELMSNLLSKDQKIKELIIGNTR